MNPKLLRRAAFAGCVGACVAGLMTLGASSLLSRRRNPSAASSAGPKNHKQQTAAKKGAQAGAQKPAGTNAQVERGRYIAEDVAMCTECHTPRLANGELDRSRWLQGAPIWIVPVHPDPNWGMRAPGLAGLLAFTEEQAEAVLERGVGPNGLPIQRPMHIYHMTHDDALAVIAYLKSLPAGYPQQ